MNQTLDSAPIGSASLDAARRVQRRRALRIVGIFVVLPTLIVGIYSGFIASRFYESVAIVAVEPALSNAPVDPRADARFLRDFALSRDGFRWLADRDGYRAHFGSRSVDPLSRLSRSASNEDAYAHFERFVNVELDPESAFLVIRCRAHDGGSAQRFTEGLVEAMGSRVVELGGGDAAHPTRKLSIVASPSRPDEPVGPRPWRSILTTFFASVALLVVVSMVISTALEHADV